MRVRNLLRGLAQSAVVAATCVVTLVSIQAKAETSDRLIIHSAEMGVGKFHRQDNRVHPYAADNAWLPYILPEGAGSDNMLVQKNADASYTIFFTNLDELLSAVVKISHDENKKVSVFNVHGHGLPGAMWFPPSAEALNDWSCSDWKDAASGSDQGNYDQYYGAVTVDEIQQIRGIADNPNVHMQCTTGVGEWQTAVAKNPEFKTVFTPDAQLHFLSCVVGLGSQGDGFTKGIAALILPAGGGGRVETSMDFGLGDWSMPGGMGFWDYQSDEQVDHDNSLYTVNHKDAEIAQKGTVRMASYSSLLDTSGAGGGWATSQVGSLQYMSIVFETTMPQQRQVVNPVPLRASQLPPLPASVRVPGTNVHVKVY